MQRAGSSLPFPLTPCGPKESEKGGRGKAGPEASGEVVVGDQAGVGILFSMRGQVIKEMQAPPRGRNDPVGTAVIAVSLL